MNSLLLRALALLTLPALAFAQDTTAPDPVETPANIKLGVGYDYSRGSYGLAQDTEVTFIPLHLNYDQGRWAFKASIPFITIEGPATVVAGGGTGGGGGGGAPTRPITSSESGLGDITVSGTYHLRPVPGELNIDFTTRVKFGTADEDKGLGTGETDYYVQFDVYQNFGVITPFANVGYRFLGSNTSFQLEDGFYATAGAAFRVNDTTIVGAAYDWRYRIIDGAENGTDALGFVSYTPNETWNVLGYILVGFNDASPDLGLGTLLSYKF
jgi:hypothetical protein